MAGDDVPVPDVAGKPRRAALGHLAGALGQANADKRATRECQADQRARVLGDR